LPEHSVTIEREIMKIRSRKRLLRFLRAWLFPLGKLEAAAGWVQSLWLLALFLLPPAISSSISETASLGSWKTLWSLFVLLFVLLALALSSALESDAQPALDHCV
jgi:hypothetical protein